MSGGQWKQKDSKWYHTNILTLETFITEYGRESNFPTGNVKCYGRSHTARGPNVWHPCPRHQGNQLYVSNGKSTFLITVPEQKPCGLPFTISKRYRIFNAHDVHSLLSLSKKDRYHQKRVIPILHVAGCLIVTLFTACPRLHWLSVSLPHVHPHAQCLI